MLAGTSPETRTSNSSRGRPSTQHVSFGSFMEIVRILHLPMSDKTMWRIFLLRPEKSVLWKGSPLLGPRVTGGPLYKLWPWCSSTDDSVKMASSLLPEHHQCELTSREDGPFLWICWNSILSFFPSLTLHGFSFPSQQEIAKIKLLNLCYKKHWKYPPSIDFHQATKCTFPFHLGTLLARKVAKGCKLTNENIKILANSCKSRPEKKG